MTKLLMLAPVAFAALALGACTDDPPTLAGTWSWTASDCGDSSSGPQTGTFQLVASGSGMFTGTQMSNQTTVCLANVGEVLATLDGDDAVLRFAFGTDEATAELMTGKLEDGALTMAGLRPGANTDATFTFTAIHDANED